MVLLAEIFTLCSSCPLTTGTEGHCILSNKIHLKAWGKKISLFSSEKSAKSKFNLYLLPFHVPPRHLKSQNTNIIPILCAERGII